MVILMRFYSHHFLDFGLFYTQFKVMDRPVFWSWAFIHQEVWLARAVLKAAYERIAGTYREENKDKDAIGQ